MMAFKMRTLGLSHLRNIVTFLDTMKTANLSPYLFKFKSFCILTISWYFRNTSIFILSLWYKSMHIDSISLIYSHPKYLFHLLITVTFIYFLLVTYFLTLLCYFFVNVSFNLQNIDSLKSELTYCKSFISARMLTIIESILIQ